MGKTSIEWTDFSINPIRAIIDVTGAVGHYCEKISSGCANCYASTLQKRFRMPSFGRVKTEMPEGVDVFLDHSKLNSVMKRRSPTKYFWCDMTDMFGWWVPDEWLDKCFAVMALTPQHTHQVLTKRPERAAEYFHRIANIDWWIEAAVANREQREVVFNRDPSSGLSNVWIGTSIENQKAADERIPHLLEIPAAVRFLSLEPLLEDLGEIDLTGISWCIVGGESGHDARFCNVQWIRDIRDQCRAAGVPCFVKQLGAVATGEIRCSRCGRTEGGWSALQCPDGEVRCPNCAGTMPDRWSTKDKKGGDWDEWPEDLKVREFPEPQTITGG